MIKIKRVHKSLKEITKTNHGTQNECDRILSTKMEIRRNYGKKLRFKSTNKNPKLKPMHFIKSTEGPTSPEVVSQTANHISSFLSQQLIQNNNTVPVKEDKTKNITSNCNLFSDGKKDIKGDQKEYLKEETKPTIKDFSANDKEQRGVQNSAETIKENRKDTLCSFEKDKMEQFMIKKERQKQFKEELDRQIKAKDKFKIQHEHRNFQKKQISTKRIEKNKPLAETIRQDHAITQKNKKKQDFKENNAGVLNQVVLLEKNKLQEKFNHTLSAIEGLKGKDF